MFIFDSVRLGLSSSENNLQIADRCRPPSSRLAVCAMFLAIISPSLTLETSEVSAILVLTTTTTQPRPQVFSVNGALTCRGLHF